MRSVGGARELTYSDYKGSSKVGSERIAEQASWRRIKNTVRQDDLNRPHQINEISIIPSIPPLSEE